MVNSNSKTNNSNSNSKNKNKNKNSKSNSNSKNKRITKQNFNNVIAKYASEYEIYNPKNTGRGLLSNKDYQNSFTNIIEFGKEFTAKQKQAIDVIIYNASNNDGVLCGYIAWKYLYLENGNKNLKILNLKPSSHDTKADFRLVKNEQYLKDKVVFIADIQYGQANLDFLSKTAKEVIIIDDHTEAGNTVKLGSNVKRFLGDNMHASLAYVWKFFYPKEPVPLLIKYIDNDDRKLNLENTPYTTLFAGALRFRYTSSPYYSQYDKQNPEGNFFNDINKILEKGDGKLLLFIGKYFDEVVENLKEQIAVNDGIENFQGYKVVAMNFNAPALSKKVCLQMLSNADKNFERGDQRYANVDFGLVWGWEYGANAYKITMHERKGSAPKYNLPELAKKLGKIGGTSRGGSGSKFLGNFYWPKNKDMDIWDLFSKKYV